MRPPRTGLALLALLGLLACGTACGTGPAPAGPPTGAARVPSSGSTGSAAATGPPVAERVPVPGGAAAPAPAVDPAARPVHLTIPSIGVDTTLTTLGIDPDGALQVPVDYQQVGWLDRSPPPGDRGPAVLAGHVDSASGPAAFYRLHELVPGAAVVVTRADGTQVPFAVDGVQQYAKDAFPTATVYGPVPGPVLRLITCGGTFDRSTGHYRDNLVVYATRRGA